MYGPPSSAFPGRTLDLLAEGSVLSTQSKTLDHPILKRNTHGFDYGAGEGLLRVPAAETKRPPHDSRKPPQPRGAVRA